MGQFGLNLCYAGWPKITYLLNELCKSTQIWSKPIYTQPKPTKNMLSSYHIDELC